MRNACRQENFYKEHRGKRYCVLHYPGTEKKEDFQESLQRKLKAQDFDFRGVWFPDNISFEDFAFNTEVNFHQAHFNAPACFDGAKFNADAYFSGTQFEGVAGFRRAQFSGNAKFSYAQFKGSATFESARFYGRANFFAAKLAFANFLRSQFDANADFQLARLEGNTQFAYAVFNSTVYFQKAEFIKKYGAYNQSATSDYKMSRADILRARTEAVQVDFSGAKFKDSISFEMNKLGEHVSMNFAGAIFDKPERVTFYAMTLRPHWFVQVDSRKFTFINVDWGVLHKESTIRGEIIGLEKSRREYLSRSLDVTFRQLAVNAEENNRYEEAGNFRYMAMDVKRLQKGRKVDLFRLSWWYWLLSGYGERVQRAFGALLIIWILFACVYWTGNATWWQPKQSGRLLVENNERKDQLTIIAAPLTFLESLLYSASVMTLQKPEPLPANKRAKALVLIETILGPIQAALLALAVRRKFMR